MKKYFILSLPLLYLCTSFVIGVTESPPRGNLDKSVLGTIPLKHRPVVIWQPSHQTNTGVNFSEAAVCNGIVEAAMAAEPRMKEYKVWSLGQKNLHHADVGSNTIVEQTLAVINGQLSGYAWELQKSNKKEPEVFISVHNNGGTKRHAIWGYIHEGDKYEAENRALASRLIKAISAATGLEDRGVLFDSSTGRNDYKCMSSGKLAFFSLDENVNKAPYRVLLEVGDNDVSKEFLENPANQKKIGMAIKAALAEWMSDRK